MTPREALQNCTREDVACVTLIGALIFVVLPLLAVAASTL